MSNQPAKEPAAEFSRFVAGVLACVGGVSLFAQRLDYAQACGVLGILWLFLALTVRPTPRGDTTE